MGWGIAVTAGINLNKEDSRSALVAGEVGCYPWLIPAGKLVSAHRAWRPTLHGGWVSGGRQWGVAGLPTWWVTIPWQCETLHGHFDDA